MKERKDYFDQTKGRGSRAKTERLEELKELNGKKTQDQERKVDVLLPHTFLRKELTNSNKSDGKRCVKEKSR